MQATQTHRITPKEHTLDNSHREHTHRYTTHKQSPHPSSRADTDSTPYKHTQGLTHTPQRATAPTFPWTDTTTPCGPQHKLGARHTHTPRRDTCRSTTPHTRAPTAGPDAPPCAVTAPPPRRRHVRPPRPPGESGANNRLLLGRSPRPQEPQTTRSASRPLSPPPAGARLGCGRPSLPYPPRPSRTAGAGAVGVDSLPRGRTGRQGALPSPHPIVCKQTRQTAEAPALLDP